MMSWLVVLLYLYEYMVIVEFFVISGFASSTISMYIAECAPNHMRGQLVTFNNAFITGGQFVASIVGGIFSKDTVNGWRLENY